MHHWSRSRPKAHPYIPGALCSYVESSPLSSCGSSCIQHSLMSWRTRIRDEMMAINIGDHNAPLSMLIPQSQADLVLCEDMI